MNKVILIGNLASDPEMKEFSSGSKNCSFRLAVQRSFKNSSGIYDSDFLPVVCWRQTADFVGNYMHKGNRAAVEGSIQTRSYDGSDGQKRYVTEIIADHVENLTPRQNGNSANQGKLNAKEPDDFVEVDLDNLPF